MDKLDAGILFDSHAEFLFAKNEYERASNTVLGISRSEKIRPSDPLSALFRYQRFSLVCKAGKERLSQSRGIRQSSTIKKNCPFEVRITLSGEKYKVISTKGAHENHNTDQQTYNHYSENMCLRADEEKFVEEMIKSGGKKQKIKNILMEKRNGQPVSLKSIHNVQNKMRRDVEHLIGEQTELEKLLENMNKIPNARVKAVVNDANELLGILFQDQRMASVYERYPEVLLVDATYKLNNRRIPLFIMLVVDGNGESEIACLWFIKNESKECISPMIDAFMELNSSWTKTKVIISDKDLAERVVFSEKFNGIPIQICLFHALRNFNREITTAKRGISIVERENVLEILCKMAYSRSSLEYDNLYTQLCSLNFPLVTEYFDENWHAIRNEWTLHGRNEWNNYMNYTNNRLESLNQKLKIIGTHYASLLSFFDNLVQSYSVISSEKDIKVVKSTMKVKRLRFDDVTLERYNEFRTSYIFKKLSYEYERAEKVPFTSLNDGTAVTKYGLFQEVYTKEDTCTCGFFKTMALPCRHVFQFQKSSNLEMFVPNLCAVRWSKRYYHESHPALSSISPVTNIPIHNIVMKVPEEIEKYKSAAKLTKDINGLMSTLPPGQYDLYMDKLKRLRGEISIDDTDQREDTENIEGDSTTPLDLTLNSSIVESITSEKQTSATSHAIPSPTNDFHDNRSNNTGLNDLTSNVANENVPILKHHDTIDEQNLSGPTSNFVDIRKISLPLKNVAVGRPKGSGRTAVGTKRKNVKKDGKASVSQPVKSHERVTRSSNRTKRSNDQNVSQDKQPKKRQRSLRV